MARQHNRQEPRYLVEGKDGETIALDREMMDVYRGKAPRRELSEQDRRRISELIDLKLREKLS